MTKTRKSLPYVYLDSEELLVDLQKLAASKGQNDKFVASKAIREYLEREDALQKTMKSTISLNDVLSAYEGARQNLHDLSVPRRIAELYFERRFANNDEFKLFLEGVRKKENDRRIEEKRKEEWIEE